LAVIGAIYTGIATATEAAALGCITALIIALIMRRLTFRIFIESINETLHTTGLIFFIVLGAVLFTKFLALSGMPGAIAGFAGAAEGSPWVLILIIVVIYLLLGMFLYSLGLMLLTLPVVLPLVEAAGFNMIWFGIIVVKLVEIGLITPPAVLIAIAVKLAMRGEDRFVTLFRGLVCIIAGEFVIVVLLSVSQSSPTILPSLSHSSQDGKGIGAFAFRDKS